ncbi:hypothetical protein CJ030_MR3G012334 [Morella rubra]|uniref:Uncharacterized protein n=1 Tax=Morella rubra TaxID=262757 RepID=A0A6A1W771_9ROSI|nr:hypothetical protein CJ030_MR3G012334 [Morella rubra]
MDNLNRGRQYNFSEIIVNQTYIDIAVQYCSQRKYRKIRRVPETDETGCRSKKLRLPLGSCSTSKTY